MTLTTNNTITPPPKRVLHLVEYLYHGGIERLLCDFAKHLPESRVNQIFFAYEMNEYKGASKEIYNSGRNIILYKKSKGFDFNLLNKLIDLKDIDIIHTHDYGPMEYAFALKLFNPRLKLIHTQHTIHHFINNKKYKCLFQLYSRFYSKVATVSNSVSEELLKSCKFINKERLVTIPNGVDLSRYMNSTSDISLDDETLNIVSIGRISEEKNFNYIIDVCSALKAQGISFQLHHAGAGNPLQEKRMLELIKMYNLGDEIKLYGYISDVRNVLKKAKVFISASKTEGHPVSVLEAMASSKICILSNIPGHSNISPDGVNLFELDKFTELIDLLKDIKIKPDKYINRSKIALEDVKKKYSVIKMLETYTHHYKEICN